jgi:hypothetical protein
MGLVASHTEERIRIEWILACRGKMVILICFKREERGKPCRAVKIVKTNPSFFGGVSPKLCVVLGSFNFYCTAPKISMAVRRNDLLLLCSKATAEPTGSSHFLRERSFKNWKESVRYFTLEGALNPETAC